MNKKKAPVRLSSKALTALKNAYATEFKNRADKLEEIQEYSFSILLYWNRVEAILKVLYYYKHIDKDYPDKLTFINRSWSVLKNAYNGSNDHYETILGDGSKASGSLWHTRDLITHANHSIVESDFKRFKISATWLADQLITNLPKSYSLAHNEFLQHKKKKILNIKKETSD